jgi:uncharacterized metal-binding protein YceD (DUF177 family)
MANPLLDDVLPRDLAERGQVFEIKEEVGKFSRLVEIIEKDLSTTVGSDAPRGWRQAPVAIRLAFSWADVDRLLPRVSGRVTVRLATVCQRCLEAFELPVAADIDMLLIAAGPELQEPALAGDVELWEMEKERVRLVDLVEESLVMAMPLAPMHESKDACGSLVRDMAEIEESVARPFANLRAQMERAED